MKKVIEIAIALGLGLLAGLLIARLLFPCPEPIPVKKEVVKVVETDTVYIKEFVEVPVPAPTPVTIPVEQPDGTLVETPVNRYRGQQVFPESGAKLDYEIDASDLFATRFTLDVPKVKETVTITETITKVLPARSRLFAGGGLDFDWETQEPEAVNIGLMYNRRNKWQLGAGINHDISGELPSGENLNFAVRFYIGL